MAQVGRSGITSIINNNIYDNNAKEIDPEKVRAVLNQIRDSYFNLVDDLLKNVEYDTGVTLEETINAGSGVLLHSKSGNIPVRTAQEGQSYNGDGNATFTVSASDGNHDDELYIQVSFSNVGTSNYHPIIGFEVTGSPWHENNAVFASFSNPTATTLRIYLQRVYNNPVGKIWLTLLKLPS